MSARSSTALPRACSGAIYAAVPSTNPASVIAGVVNAFGADGAGARLERFRDAEVEHLDDAVGLDLDVGGLQIAVHDALLVRGLERAAICSAMPSASFGGSGPCAMRSANVGPSTSSMTSAVVAPLFSSP